MKHVPSYVLTKQKSYTIIPIVCDSVLFPRLMEWRKALQGIVTKRIWVNIFVKPYIAIVVQKAFQQLVYIVSIFPS